MKTKDFYLKLKKDGKINNAKFDAFIESLSDSDIDDEIVQAFENSFYTLERASTHKEIHSKLKADNLSPVERDLTKIVGLIDTVDKFKASEIDKMQSTYDKLAAVRDYLPVMLDKVKATPQTDEETKNKLSKAEETVQGLMKKIETMNSDYERKVKEVEKKSEESINNFKLRNYLEKQANSYKFGKAYAGDEVRKALTKVTLDTLQANNRLAYVAKDGQETVSILDESGQPRFINNGNTPLTINHLLEESFKPYIKVSNTGEDDDNDDDNQGQQSSGQATKRFSVNDDTGKTRRQGARTTVE